MTDPLRPINLPAALAVVETVLDVCAGVPGAPPRALGVPWVFPEVSGDNLALPGGDLAQNTRARLTYEVISIVGLGSDETRVVYDPDIDMTESADGDTYEPDPEDPEARLGAVVENVSGNRLVTIQVKCEVHAADAAGPFVYLERVRTRMGLGTVNKALDAAGFAVNDITDASPADFKDDSGRTVRAAMIEIIFNAADCAADDPVTTIEQIDTPALVELEDL